MILTLPYGVFETDATDWMNGQIQEVGFFDPELQPFFDRHPPGSRVMDVGAHIGLYTGYLASRGCRVIAFEGHPVYAPLLQRNIDQNGWEVEVHSHFLYSRSVSLTEDLEHETRASNTWLPSAFGEAAYPLDYCWGLSMSPTISLIKIDAQGADLHVLLGAGRLIARDRPAILIEFEAPLALRHGHTADDYRTWMRQHDYREVSINGLNAYLTPKERP